MKNPAVILLQLLAALAALAAFAASPSGAQASGLRLDEAGVQEFPERTYTVRTPDRVALDEDDVTVTENGEGIGSVSVASAASGARFGTVLVIDASRSMEANAAIDGALRAARAFARRRAPGQSLGVVAFNRRTNVLLPLTASDEEISEAVSGTPTLGPSTHLNDALLRALDMLRYSDTEAGSIVLLSDGKDTGSSATESEVAAAATEAGVRIFAVGLRSREFEPASLRRLAVGGSVADAATPSDLAPILDRFGAQLASEHLISYESRAGAADAVTVEVEVAGAGVAVDQYRVPANLPVSAVVEEGFWSSSAAMVAAIAVAAAMLGIALWILVRPRRVTLRARLHRFIGSEDAAEVDLDRPRGAEDGPLVRIERSVQANWWNRFVERLELARIETPATHIAMLAAIGTLLVLLVTVRLFDAPILAPLALAVPFGVRAWAARRLRAVRREFAEQLADNLQLVTSGIRSGQSMAAAFSVVVDEAAEPSRTEFMRIVNDERLGVPLEDAINEVAERMGSRDLVQVALVAKIQRETGGNTAEVLDQVVVTVREREGLRRLMETLTAQGKLTQIIISILPVALLVAITLVNRDYLTPLFETTGGNIALGFSAVLSVAGSLIIRRIVEVRV